jgi:hypothetical protein
MHAWDRLQAKTLHFPQDDELSYLLTIIIIIIVSG